MHKHGSFYRITFPGIQIMTDGLSLPTGTPPPQFDNPNMSMLERLAKKPGINNKEPLTDKEKQEYAKAAKGFESMFVHLMMKQMKEAMLKKDEKEGDMSFGADTLSNFTDLQFADYVTQNGGTGFANVVYKHLTGEDLSTLPKTSNTDLNILMKLGSQGTPSKVNDLLSVLSNKSSQDEEDEDITLLTGPHIVNKNSGNNPDDLHQRALADLRSRIALRQQAEQSSSMSFTSNGFAASAQERIDRFDPIIRSASAQYGVPEHLVRGVMASESAGKVTAQSSAGAKGLMQLMDGTAKEMGVTNIFDPEQNIHGGVKYLGQLLKQYNGNTTLALAAYNAGPGNVDKYNGIPPFPETQAYVRNVMRRAEQFKAL